MTVSYHKRCNGEPQPDYHCSREGIATGTPPCQSICGAGVDQAVAKLVLEQLTPLAIETALAVSAELAQRAADADRIRQMGVQRAEHAAEAARRRYLAVDPTNRLVADQLEADWNNKLRELADAKDEYERATHAGNRPLTDQQQAQIRALADRPTRAVGQPGDPDAGTQAADPPARHRRHAEQDQASRSPRTSASQAASSTRCRCHGRCGRGRRTPRHPRRSR